MSFQTGAETILLLLPFKKVMCSCSMACTFHHRLIENMVTLIANKNVALMDKVDILSKKSLREKIATYLMQEAVNIRVPILICHLEEYRWLCIFVQIEVL